MTEFASDAEKPINPPVRRSATRNILTVMSGTLTSRVLGLVRQTLFNRLFPTEITDAFNVAYRVPNLFRELLAEGALTSSIIPVYKNLPPEERKAYTSSLTGALAAVNLIVVGLGILLAPFVIGLRIASGGSVNMELTITLTRILWPFLAGISFSALAMALLNAEERFSATSFSPLAFSLVSIVGFLLFPGNATLLAVFTTLGGFAQFFVQLPSLRRFGLMPKLGFSWHPALGRTFSLMIPFTFTTGTREFLTIVLTTLLSGFPAGAVTGFTNADQIFLLGLGLFAVSPALAAYPRLAENAAAKDWQTFNATISSYARLVLVPDDARGGVDLRARTQRGDGALRLGTARPGDREVHLHPAGATTVGARHDPVGLESVPGAHALRAATHPRGNPDQRRRFPGQHRRVLRARAHRFRGHELRHDRHGLVDQRGLHDRAAPDWSASTGRNSSGTP